jgi:death-on-curing protein
MRTGFVVGVVFLEMNGSHFTASEAAQAVLELAAGTIDETGFALFLRDHVKCARKRK